MCIKPQKVRNLMTHARTYSLLTIVFSFGLLLLGASVHLTDIFSEFPKIELFNQIAGMALGVLTLFLTFSLFKDNHNDKSPSGVSYSIPVPQSLVALIIVGVLGLMGGSTTFYRLPTILNTTHFFLGLIFITLIINIDHRLSLGPKGPLILNRDNLNTLLRRRFHFSDGLALVFIMGLGQLTLAAFTKHAQNRIELGSQLISFLNIISIIYLCFAGYWMFLVGEKFKALGGLFKFGPWPIYLNLGIWFLAYENPQITILSFMTFAIGVLSLAIIWKTNLVVRSIEKEILKEERFSFWSDILEITKPRLGLLVMSTVFVGMMLAPRDIPFFKGLAGFTFTFLLVMGAAAYNCWMEIDIDALMDRTKDRPLPTGRMRPEVALIFSSSLMILSIIGLYYTVNLTTAALGLAAAVLYVFAYTPLKQKSVLALYVGAIPGAIPPLMGWTIVMGKMTAMAWILFAILFVWQLPHFLAISIYHAEDYGKAKIKVYPNSFGLKLTKWGIFLLTGVLAYVSLYAWWHDLGVTDRFGYFAIILNILFMGVATKVLMTPVLNKKLLRKWARIYFLGSIFYLPLLLGSMIYLS